MKESSLKIKIVYLRMATLMKLIAFRRSLHDPLVEWLVKEADRSKLGANGVEFIKAIRFQLAYRVARVTLRLYKHLLTRVKRDASKWVELKLASSNPRGKN